MRESLPSLEPRREPHKPLAPLGRRDPPCPSFWECSPLAPPRSIMSSGLGSVDRTQAQLRPVSCSLHSAMEEPTGGSTTGGGHHTREHQRREHYRKIMAPSALCCQPRICNLGVWFWRPMSGSSQEPPSYGLAPSLSPCVGQMTSPRVLLWGAPCHFHVTAQASAPSCAFLSWAAIRSDIPQDPTGRDFSTYDANMRAQAYNVACMQTLVKSTHIHRSICT